MGGIGACGLGGVDFMDFVGLERRWRMKDIVPIFKGDDAGFVMTLYDSCREESVLVLWIPCM